jgi:hypothetical protein
LTRRGDILRELDRLASARESWQTALTLYEALEDPRAEDIRARLLSCP